MFRRLSPFYALVLILIISVACSTPEMAAPAASDSANNVGATFEEEDEEELDCSFEEVLCVGLVTDVGQVDDKSFNQAAYEGLIEAEAELGAIVDFIETQGAEEYEENIELFAENDFDIIVTVGFALGDATQIMAEEFPEIIFIGVDQFQMQPIDNVTGLIFADDHAGYLAGALAALMSERGKIAAVLGTNLVPPVVAFKEGYEAGARAVNPDIEIISTYHPGGLDEAFLDPEWGAATARRAIDQGADVVFGAGGKTGNGALVEVAKHDGVYCIGVDSDQWGTLPEAHPCLISSAMKLISPSVFDLVAAAEEGELSPGNYIGEVSLAPFHDFEDIIPEGVKEELDAIDEGLRNGTISTGVEQ